MPLKVRGTNALAICFDHPVPYVAFHLLIIPKRRIRSVFELAQPAHADAFAAVLELAATVVSQLGSGAYFLTINWGSRQDVMQAHWHVTQARLTGGAGLTRWPIAETGAHGPVMADVIAAVVHALQPEHQLAAFDGFTIELPVQVEGGVARWASAFHVSVA